MNASVPKIPASANQAEEHERGPDENAGGRDERGPRREERAPGRGKYDRSRTPDERHREQRDRLLDAAGYVFAEMGWADTTVEAIVSRAGMSRRTFYEHFDDLKDCLFTFHQVATHRAFRVVERDVVNANENDEIEMLRAGIHGFLRSVAKFPHIARVIFRVVRAAGSEFETAHDQMIDRFVQLLHGGAVRAYMRGRLNVEPTELRVFTVISGIEAVAMRYVLRGEEEKAMVEAAPMLIDMVERAFGWKGLESPSHDGES